MASLRASATAATALFFAVGCHLIGGIDGYVEGSKTDDDGGVGASGGAPGAGGASSSANGGAGTGTPPGTGGMLPTCDQTECEAQATTVCEECNCIDGLVCSCVPKSPGMVCDDGSPGVCFDGACVPCIQNSDCPGEMDSCENNVCVGPSCMDGVLNGTETDTDCGGSCAPCPIGSACIGPADCASSYCPGQICSNCTTDGDCGGGRYCYGNVCHNKKPNGQGCEQSFDFHENWCLSGNCCFGSCTSVCVGICSCE